MLVGRESELSLLAERIEQRRAIAVLGEAGVGKTALVRAAAERAGQRLYEAGALATLSWLPYLPLRRAFGHEFGNGDAAYVASEVEREVGDGLLFLDDLHWVDAQTGALLPLLAGRIPLVGAIRRGDPATAAALEATAGAGLELLPLEPLPSAEAGELAALLHPELSQSATERLVSRSGGNPFLLEQLAATGDPSESLKLALAARLRSLSSAGREAIGLLALAGRPLERRDLGEPVTELISGGLAAPGDLVSVRHALIAETIAEQFDDTERRRLHGRLAQMVAEVGEAARHHAAAGELDEAVAKAVEAADRAALPGERAAHLRLAATCARGPGADDLRLRAAAAMCEVDDMDGLDALLDAVEGDDPIVQARTWLIRANLRYHDSDSVAAKVAVERGAAAAHGTGDDVEIELALADARFAAYRDDEDALEKARRAVRLASERGRYEAAAALGLARPAMLRELPGWQGLQLDALALARRDGDLGTELGASNNLVFGYIVLGELESAEALAAEMQGQCAALRLTEYARRFRGWRAGIAWHAGHPRAAVEHAESTLAEVLYVNDRRAIEFYLCQALIDLGRLAEAEKLAQRMLLDVRRASADGSEVMEAMWACADAALWSGRPAEAVAAAEEFSFVDAPGGVSESPHAFVGVTHAWARFEAGLAPQSRPLDGLAPIAEGAPVELDAISALAGGDYAAAAELFGRAGALWAERHFRGELRSRWAAGEAHRRAGAMGRARESLLEAERLALAREYHPLLARIRRSLRLAGVPRSAPRMPTGGRLTARELEVLELVAEGLTNDEIGRRLGVARPTVVRLIRTASLKLGAKNRAQAAVLARR